MFAAIDTDLIPWKPHMPVSAQSMSRGRATLDIDKFSDFCLSFHWLHGNMTPKCASLLGMRFVPGMAYRLNLADNRLPIFDQSRLPITDIISVLNFTDTDNRYSINCRYIGVLRIYRGKITKI